MSSARVCLQWTMVGYNVLSLLIGILALAGGIYELEKYNDGSVKYIEKIVQLAAAGILIISAFIGCTAAVNGSIKFICIFVVVLIALIITHIWKLLRYNESLQLAAAEGYVEYTWIQELVRSGAMRKLQKTYECCGKKGFTDYTRMRSDIPKSCFHVKDKMHATYPYAEGCLSAVKRAYLDVYRFEKWCHAGLICFELLGITLATTLSCQLTTRKYNY